MSNAVLAQACDAHRVSFANAILHKIVPTPCFGYDLKLSCTISHLQSSLWVYRVFRGALKSNAFYNLFRNSIDDIDKFMIIVNRWEGNSIRVDREEFLKVATHVKLDFNFLNDSILKYFTEFENKTTNILVKYINDIDNKVYYQKLMCEEIENIINLIEKKIKGINK